MRRNKLGAVLGIGAVILGGCSLQKEDYTPLTNTTINVNSRHTSWKDGSVDIMVKDPDGIKKVKVGHSHGTYEYDLEKEGNPKSYSVKVRNIDETVVVNVLDSLGNETTQSFVNRNGEVYQGAVNAGRNSFRK